MKPGSAIISIGQLGHAEPNLARLCGNQGSAIQNFTGGLAQMVAGKGIRANAVIARTDLDAVDSVDDA
jgi:hypothetical protein